MLNIFTVIFTFKNCFLSYICNLNLFVNFQCKFISFLNIVLLSEFFSVFNYFIYISRMIN